MEHIFSALIPIFLLILIGYYFKKIKFPPNDFWASADKLTYFVLMPSLLIYKLSTANLEGLEAFDFVLTGLLGIVLVLVLNLILNLKIKTPGAPFSSVVQGAVRFNTYVYLALITAMFGDDGIALAALLIWCVLLSQILLNRSNLYYAIWVKELSSIPSYLKIHFTRLIQATCHPRDYNIYHPDSYRQD